jgi:hypothetical protein
MDRSRNRCDIEPHLPEDAILASAEFFEVRFRTIPKKMT